MRRLLLRLNAKSDAGGLNKKWKRSNILLSLQNPKFLVCDDSEVV